MGDFEGRTDQSFDVGRIVFQPFVLAREPLVLSLKLGELPVHLMLSNRLADQVVRARAEETEADEPERCNPAHPLCH